jgi:hypothetical protein
MFAAAPKLRPRVVTPILAFAFAFAFAFGLAGHPRASAGTPTASANDVGTVFSIRRSLNRNRVDYGVRLDASCRAEGREPVFAYWRMLESGEGVQSLRRIERRAYGIASQEVRHDPRGSVIELRLRALPDRPIVVHTRMGSGQCETEALTPIAGVEAVLRDIYVVLAGGIRVDRVEIRGERRGGGGAVAEAIRD